VTGFRALLNADALPAGVGDALDEARWRTL
jgi:hypothetical protein